MLLNPCNTAEATDWCVAPSDIARFSLGRVLPLLLSGRSLTRLVFINSTGPSQALPLENLLELSLTSCFSRASELRNLLQYCKCLRKFDSTSCWTPMTVDARGWRPGLALVYPSTCSDTVSQTVTYTEDEVCTDGVRVCRDLSRVGPWGPCSRRRGRRGAPRARPYGP